MKMAPGKKKMMLIGIAGTSSDFLLSLHTLKCFLYQSNDIKNYLRIILKQYYYIPPENTKKKSEKILSDIEKVKPFIIPDIQNPEFRERILFGTDFFMTIQEKSEKKLLDDFINQISTDDFNQIAEKNTKKYLDSDFYKT